MATSIEFTGAERDKLRTLTKWGSPLTRKAATKLLSGQTPTVYELDALISIMTHGKHAGRKKRQDARHAQSV